MNWAIKLGMWLESRRKVSHVDFKNEVKKLEEKISNSQKIPQNMAKELDMLKIRFDQLELFVGLKREPKPQHVRGMAKIG